MTTNDFGEIDHGLRDALEARSTMRRAHEDDAFGGLKKSFPTIVNQGDVECILADQASQRMGDEDDGNVLDPFRLPSREAGGHGRLTEEVWESSRAVTTAVNRRSA